MPTIDGVGFNPHSTPYKQFTLKRALGHEMGSGVSVAANRHVPYVICDMTAGVGCDPTGDGSPIIIAQHVKNLHALHNIRFLCVEWNAHLLGKLQATMAERFPDLPIEFYADQATALATIPSKAVGLTYWDPTKYKDLDANLLHAFGRSHYFMDILLTRECLAGYRMQQAKVQGTLTLPDYLALTGKRCNYIMQYAKHGWWSLGFADNWQERPGKKLKGFVDVKGTEGRDLIRKLTANEKAESPLKQGALL